MKMLNGLSWRLLSSMASVIMFVSIYAAGVRSWVNSHEPKVPARLRRN